MGVCQYFLEGRCWFMQNCRNQHVYSDGGGGGGPGAGRNTRSALFDSQKLNIMREVIDDIVLVEKGGQWPLSCFAVMKKGPNIPGFEDYSPEEIRWKMYEARNKGTLDQCINEVRNLYNEAEKRRNALKQPTAENMNLISNILKMKEQSTASHPFGCSESHSVSRSEGNSIFGSSVTQTPSPQNLFSGSNSTPSFGNIFGGQPQTTGNTGSIFGGSPPTTFGKQSIFGGQPVAEMQNMFSPSQNQNPFTGSSLRMSGLPQNMFSNASTGNNGNFGNSGNFSDQTTTSTPLFAAQSMLYQPPTGSGINENNIFGGGASSSSSIFVSQTPRKSETSIFTTDTPKTSHFGTNAFGSSFGQKTTAVDHSVYSKPEDITAEESRAFASATFVFGKIPLKPPTLESCKQFI